MGLNLTSWHREQHQQEAWGSCCMLGDDRLWGVCCMSAWIKMRRGLMTDNLPGSRLRRTRLNRELLGCDCVGCRNHGGCSGQE